jgi:multisubunit Na+/H+ antiporter MnhB subunit
LEIYILLIFMIVAAIAAIEIHDLLSSVLALSAVGLSLSLAFLILKAPNLAMIQLVVELLCLILLIRATINKDLPLVRDGRWLFNTISSFLFVSVFLLFGFFALKELPLFGFPQMRVSKEYLDSAMGLTGSVNLVTSITMKMRSYDSLGEAVIIFASVIGVFAVMRRGGRVHEKK